MDTTEEDLRHSLLYEYENGRNADAKPLIKMFELEYTKDGFQNFMLAILIFSLK